MKDSYFSDVVSDWALKHSEMKEDFRITYDYWATCQAFRISMEYVPYKHGVSALLDEDIMDKLVCPHYYIFAVLDRMYKTLKEDEEVERTKLRDYVQAWLIINAVDNDSSIKVKVEICGNGYAVDLIKESDGNSISASGYIARNNEDKWELLASELYKKFKEKERKEMGNFAGTVNSRCVNKEEDNDVMLKMAKAAVVAWYNEHNAPATIGMEDVYVVWFSKVLQNWKALAGTHHDDGMYYEITFDGDKDCAYVDAYKKWQNVQMSGSELKNEVC